VHAASHKTGGTGLGLAISKMIIEEHGGQIWAESVYEKGTIFHIQLRLHRLKKQQMDKKKLLILMVDDDEDYFSSSNRLLGNAGKKPSLSGLPTAKNA